MANKRTAPEGQGRTNLLTACQGEGRIEGMATTPTTDTKARGGQLKAKPVTFYPPSPEFRQKIEDVAKMKGRTASNMICFIIEDFFKSDTDSIGYDAERQTTAA
jgi:hypothetical protein